MTETLPDDAAGIARAAALLRAGGLVAGRMAVFLHTDLHGGGPWYSAQHAGRIEPTDDARALIGEAIRMLAPLWRDGGSGCLPRAGWPPRYARRRRARTTRLAPPTPWRSRRRDNI